MTKLRAYEKAAPPPVPVEREVFLKLETNRDYVLLKAVNAHGSHENCGNLLKIYPDGTFLVVEAGEIDGNDFRSRF